MLLPAKLAGILILVWFYHSGKKVGEPGIKWAIIGVIGYWITWWLANQLILAPLTPKFTQGSAMVFLLTQVPMLLAVAAGFLIRKKLISDVAKDV